MGGIWQWGLDFIHAVQSVQGPVVDGFFIAITFMGEEEFFLLLLPLLYWCIDSAWGIRLACAYFLSSYLNLTLKDVIGHPRPFVLDPEVKRFETQGEYGLPSNHSQAAVLLWGIVAARLRKAWLWVLAIVMMILVGFSRIYLGLHFPTDVLGGWTLGAILLLGYVLWGAQVEAWLSRAGAKVQLVLIVGGALAALLLHPTELTATMVAALLGLGAGAVLARRVAPFETSGPLWQRAVRFLVGVIPMLVLYIGLKMAFPGEGETLYLEARFVRYALVSLWGGLGAPWLFLKLRLAHSTAG